MLSAMLSKFSKSSFLRLRCMLGSDHILASMRLCNASRPRAHAVIGLQEVLCTTAGSSSCSSPADEGASAAAVKEAPMAPSPSATEGPMPVVDAGGAWADGEAVGTAKDVFQALVLGAVVISSMPIILSCPQPCHAGATPAACCQERKSCASKQRGDDGAAPGLEAHHSSEAACSWSSSRQMKTWYTIWYMTVKPRSHATRLLCLKSGVKVLSAMASRPKKRITRWNRRV
mmetsp:Transcript_96444/g.241839  ORF Transcript_96444/g.241839 Transcript_96444/m.241839 type:complete len:230 (+) Transcript_96444:1521-2210(+)